MTRPLAVTADQARRFLVAVHALDRPMPSVGAALAHLGYVQEDPINVCGRMHEHILRNRVSGYRQGDLERHLHGDPLAPLAAGERTAFEHHLPSTQVLVALQIDAWPHLLGAMQERSVRTSAWAGRLTARERELAKTMLAEIEARGALSSADFADGRQGRQVWGRATLAKQTLQKLFFHGRLLISGRDQNRRLYNLPERVIAPAVLGLARPSAEETRRWSALLRLRQSRLAVVRKDDLTLIGDGACEVRVPDCPALMCLNEDVELLLSAPEPNPEVRLLAPLDPLIYDRRLTRLLWGFDYTWEVYVPEHKRRRGYYALPVLAGTRLVGHVDLKGDREKGRLCVQSRKVARGTRTAPAVGALAGFLGLR